MGAAGARRWRLLLFRSKPPAIRPKNGPPEVPVPPSPPAREKEQEEVPGEFLCPILGAPMADPVILESGRTYERACVWACKELGLSLSSGPGGGVVAERTNGSGGDVAIPNDALRAAIGTWCARSGRMAPVPPSDVEAREAVLRVVPEPARSASNLSCSSSGESAASTAPSSSAGSSTEVASVGVEVLRGKEAVKEREKEPLRIAEAEEDEVVAKAVEAGDEMEVEAAVAALRMATRASSARRRGLCGPRLLAALRRVLLSSRHTASARADAAAALANLSLEPENRVPVVRAGAVPALVEVLAYGAPEACEHAAGALFGLALHEGNRAAIGVLGAVPPLLAVLATRDHAPRARSDAGMALYHLSLAAVNQSKFARAPGAAKNLLSVASDTDEPLPIRRLALMVIFNVAACAEGRTALMDAGAVATASAILSDDPRSSELQEWCVAALHGMSRGSPRFRALARAAGADRPLILIAERAKPGVHKEMARAALRTMLGLGDNSVGNLSDCKDIESDYVGDSRASAPPHRRRVASWAAPPPGTPPSPQQWRSVCID